MISIIRYIDNPSKICDLGLLLFHELRDDEDEAPEAFRQYVTQRMYDLCDIAKLMHDQDI